MVWRRGGVFVASLVILAAAPTTGTAAVAHATAKAPVVAPYLDMGNDLPASLYRAINAAHLREFTAEFVVGHGCTPTWDDGVAIARDPAVNRVITKARSLGAHVVVSFGGAGGTDLARSCRDPARLLAAYAAVVHRFGLTHLDFDIEGASLAGASSINRRFTAIRVLERRLPSLDVSLTVPVEPSGLDGQVRRLLNAAKSDHARVDLVNLMTMDYGGGSIDMGGAAISAARATLPQLRKIWPGWTYANLGITPMIGLNDNTHETLGSVKG